MTLYYNASEVLVAQWLEHPTDVTGVEGLIPTVLLGTQNLFGSLFLTTRRQLIVALKFMLLRGEKS